MSGLRRTARGVPRPVNLSMTDSYIGVLRGIQILAMVAILGSLAYSGWAWVESRRLHDDAMAYNRSTAQVHVQNRQYQQAMEEDGFILTAEQIATVDNKIAFANRLIGKRKFSWAQLLHDLDEALPKRVSLSSVQHQFKDSTTSLKGVVPDLKSLNGLVKTLEHHGAFHRVNVSNHQFQDFKEAPSGGSNTARSKQGKTTKPRTRTVIQFDLTVVYQPET